EAGTDVRVTRPDAGGHANELLTVTRDELYLSDNEETNPLLRSGDTVTVSAQEHFFIKGQVKSPGRYPVDRGTTILRAISLAGGFGEYANQKKIELLRAKDGEMVRLVINVEKIEKRKAEDILVLPGDIINVKAKFL
ncbi:MAG: polysaccharide biosynthesis/export family protein, partial [Acidobacteriota bacterium]